MKGKVISVFAGLGKTTVGKKYPNVCDLMSSPYRCDYSNISTCDYEKMKYDSTRTPNREWPNNYLKAILEVIKHFFRELLQIGNEPTKEAATTEIKDYFDNNDFDMNDVIEISRGTTKEDELFDYVKAPNYLKSNDSYYDEKEKDDFQL